MAHVNGQQDGECRRHLVKTSGCTGEVRSRRKTPDLILGLNKVSGQSQLNRHNDEIKNGSAESAGKKNKLFTASLEPTINSLVAVM